MTEEEIKELSAAIRKLADAIQLLSTREYSPLIDGYIDSRRRDKNTCPSCGKRYLGDSGSGDFCHCMRA